MTKIKIEIKNRWTGKILFGYEKENNTIKDTLLEAVSRGADLRGADLRGADLIGADLRGAYLVDAYLRDAYLIDADLIGADLRGAYLRGAYLRGADLRVADLRVADLRGAYLRGAYLSGADLSGADLRVADLRDAYLIDADLIGAYLRGADLRGADLRGAYVRGADLRGADLSGAKEIPYLPMACPSDGAFIGWKKVYNDAPYLVKLLIPEDARRSSATTLKCRCDKAQVLAITNINGENPINEVLNKSQAVDLLYKVGEMVFPDSFDEDRWNECSHGIHFFINKQDAINY